MLNSGDILPLPKPWPELTAYLQKRRSNLAKLMTGPGPTADELAAILNIAARVPDHRKLAPWRFIIFQGAARQNMGLHVRKAFTASNPDAPKDRQDFEAARFMRAPLVIAVVSAPKLCPRGTPEWEQVLSVGAVCHNMLLAAQSLGYGAQWLTEWLAYDAAVKSAIAVDANERIAGFIYIGTVDEAPKKRARPDLNERITHWAD